jgi:hypothetical protein
VAFHPGGRVSVAALDAQGDPNAVSSSRPPCETAEVNRRTLDTAVPMLYGILVVVMYLTVNGKLATIVTIVGAMLVGLYFAALRQNLRQ